LESIAEELHLTEKLSIAAEPYAVARSVEVEDMSDFGAIFIDIGGGTTDIAIVRNGGLEGTKMFALGGRAFTKRLCQEFELTLEKAEEMKIAYSFRRLSPENSEKIAALYAQDAKVWLGGVEISLSEFAETDVLPSRIFLCGGGSALPEIKQVLSSVEWTDHLPFSRPPQVSFLQPKDISRVTDQTGELNNPQDITPLGLVNLVLLNTAEHEKMLSVILERSMQSIDQN
jgi:cell division protein FtsA